MTQHGKNSFIWLALGALFFVFLYAIRGILLPFVVGMLMAYFLSPAADRLEKSGLVRPVAALFITLGFFFVLIMGGVLIIPLIVHQCAQLAEAIPGYVVDLQNRYGPALEQWLAQINFSQTAALKNAVGDVAGSMVKISGEVLSHALASGVALLTLASLLLITPLVAFYLLSDWHRLTKRVDALLPREHAKTIRTQLRAIDRTLAGFLRGQMNVCLLLAMYYGTVLSLIGLHFGLVIGIASGLLVILPYLGILCMALAALTVALLQFGVTAPFFMVVAAYLVGQVMEGYFLTPRLVGGRVGLHPLWIIFGMLSGAALFGLLGVLISVPVTAVIGVLIRFAIDRYLHSPLYSSK